MRPSKPVEEMSVEEKQFYHFKMHDYDNNNLLDGLEILQSANVHDDTLHGHHGKKPASEQLQPTTDTEGGAGSEELGLQHLVGKNKLTRFLSLSNARECVAAVNQLICDIWQINFFSGCYHSMRGVVASSACPPSICRHYR